MTSSPQIDQLRARLSKAGQSHLLSFAERVDGVKRDALYAQLASIDWEGLPGLVKEYVTGKPSTAVVGAIEPVKHYPADHTSAAGHGAWDRAAYKAKGIELIRGGKVAAFTVAGGQGSRLGYDGPKGCYPAGAVTNKPLFACLAEWILAAQKAWCPAGVTIPWYIMTSPLNDAATRAFFKERSFFGLREQDVMFFPQGVMPSFDMKTGQVLLNDLHEAAVNPDGHGGSIKALYVSGAIADMQRRGVEHISYTQIDNPLVRVIDPVFIGLHAFAPDSSGEMSSKMVAKAHAGEKVGVLCKLGGKVGVIEYSDMPKELTEATNADGSLKFNAGNAAVHVISVEFVKRLNSGGAGLAMPYHRAEKKVPHVDLVTGQRVEPTSNNAVKLETFVFDALAMCGRSIVMEALRVEEFAPIKNATGADSPESCRGVQTLRAATWLKKAGATVPMKADGTPDCVIELSPLMAMDADEVAAKGLRPSIAAGASVVL